MPRIESFDGTHIEVKINGPVDGVPILLSHYLGGTSQTWAAQVEALSNRFRVIRYDTRGHGASDTPSGPYEISMLGRDALSVMEHLGLARAHFAGLSQGGMTGMWLAANHPDKIDRLVLANTTPYIPNKPVWDALIVRSEVEGMNTIAKQTISSWLSDGFKMRHPEILSELIAIMRGMSPVGYAGSCAVLRDIDLRDDLARIAAPTLVIGGEEDGPRGAAGPAMAEAIAGARMVIIPEASHLSAIENSNAFNGAVLEHLT
jgi:3-oxoadipate enol-lactonase